MTPRLAVDSLRVAFGDRDRPTDVLRDVGFDVLPGEIVGLIGESGCGKSLTLLSILGLLPPSGHIRSGSIRLDGEELVGSPGDRLRRLRGGDIGMIFQDPQNALNPSHHIRDQVVETLRLHGLAPQGRRELAARARALLEEVGIPSPEERLDSYPHEFSGGMQQRVLIAAALACRPRLLLADEPTTALDVTVQAQIIDLLRKVNRDLGCSIVLVTHDLALASNFCDRLVVMYAGQVVESGPTQAVIQGAAHPYTQGLLDCLPLLGAGRRSFRPIPGEVPVPGRLPDSACTFAPRCAFATEICRTGPIPVARAGAEHVARCVLVREEPREASA